MTTLYSVATIAMPFQAQYKAHQLHPSGDLHTHTHTHFKSISAHSPEILRSVLNSTYKR